MKNNLKRIFVLSLFFVCLLSLCSCNMLDEIKNKQVIFDEEYPETVEFRGEKYERITRRNLSRSFSAKVCEFIIFLLFTKSFHTFFV